MLQNNPISLFHVTHFGSAINTRSYSSGAYRYGFNGKELDKDEEGMGGGGSTYDYGFRIYNPSLCRFLSVDPLSSSYPWYSPYQFAGNKPIIAIDIDGLEEYDYKLFAEGMIKGEEILKTFKFPEKGDKPITLVGKNDFFEYSDGFYGGIVMKSGKNPAEAIKYIFEHPELFKIDCGSFVQLAKLYAMLYSIGEDKFNAYIGKTLNIKTHGSTGINYKDIWYNDDLNPGFMISSDRSKPHKKVEEVLEDADVGTEITITVKGLPTENPYHAENIVKVGKNKYLAQGLGDGPMSLKKIQKELRKKQKEAGIEKKERKKESLLSQILKLPIQQTLKTILQKIIMKISQIPQQTKYETL